MIEDIINPKIRPIFFFYSSSKLITPFPIKIYKKSTKNIKKSTRKRKKSTRKRKRPTPKPEPRKKQKKDKKSNSGDEYVGVDASEPTLSQRPRRETNKVLAFFHHPPNSKIFYNSYKKQVKSMSQTLNFLKNRGRISMGEAQ